MMGHFYAYEDALSRSHLVRFVCNDGAIAGRRIAKVKIVASSDAGAIGAMPTVFVSDLTDRSNFKPEQCAHVARRFEYDFPGMGAMLLAFCDGCDFELGPASADEIAAYGESRDASREALR